MELRCLKNRVISRIFKDFHVFNSYLRGYLLRNVHNENPSRKKCNIRKFLKTRFPISNRSDFFLRGQKHISNATNRAEFIFFDSA